MLIFIGILIGIICAALAIFLYDYIDKNPIGRKQFDKEQAQIIASIKRKRDDFDQQLQKDFDVAAQANQEQINNLVNQYSIVEQNYKNQESQLKENYEKEQEQLKENYQKEQAQLIQQNQKLKEKLQVEFEDKQQWYKEEEQRAALARSEANEKEIAQAAQRQSESLRKLEEDYKDKIQTLQTTFEKYQINYKERKENLDKQIKEYEDKQKAIIEQFKKDEENKQKQDFYRIKLSEEQIDDVKKLRKIADELHNPIILYKLIWENYYKTKFSELIGRIAPDNKKCGIYKITNLNNGKVYIGQTKQTFNDRWRSHVRRGLKAEPGTNNKLYTAMWEDGVENFTFEILEECKAEELNEKEKYFIQFFKSQEWGYNSTGGNK